MNNAYLSWPIKLFVIPFLLVFLGADDIRDEAVSIELKRIKEEIYAINLIYQLELTGNQIDFILKRSEISAPIVAAFNETVPEIYRKQLKAFRALRKEDEADKGFSASVERAAAKANSLKREMTEKMNLRLNIVAEPIIQILTDKQKITLTNFKPDLFPNNLNTSAQDEKRDWRIKKVTEVLMDAVSMTDNRYKHEQDKLVMRLINILPKNKWKNTFGKGIKTNKKKAAKKSGKVSLEDRDDTESRLIEAMDYLREIPKEDASHRVDHFIMTRIFPSKTEQLERKLNKVQKSKYVALTNEARFLLNIDVIPFLEKLKKRRPAGDPVGIR